MYRIFINQKDDDSSLAEVVNYTLTENWLHLIFPSGYQMFYPIHSIKYFSVTEIKDKKDA
jgi:hypothetical protein